MRVFLSSHLRDYTGGRAEIGGAGGNLIGLMDDLDRQYPGLKFRLVDEQGRLRPHLNVFVDPRPSQAPLGRRSDRYPGGAERRMRPDTPLRE